VLWLGLLLLLVVLRVLLPAGTPPLRPRESSGSRRGVAVLERIRLGASDQWILLRGEVVENPVILFLHGGPGAAQLTSYRRATRDLERSFVVVNWDQRGAGKSYRAIRDTARMNVEQFVEDTRDLTLLLRKRLRKDRIILVGHSWGSVIGALTAARYPELFYCYVGVGQVANMKEGEAASYRWTLDRAREHGDRRAIRTLEAIGPPPYRRDWQASTLTQRKLLARFGGEVYGSGMGALRMVLGGLAWSREYTIRDRLNFFRGVVGSMRLLWPELMEVDLVALLPELKIPVVFVEGRFDWEVPSVLAARYFEVLKAPSKSLVWFEESAHLPYWEEQRAFNRMMVEKILPLASRGGDGDRDKVDLSPL